MFCKEKRVDVASDNVRKPISCLGGFYQQTVATLNPIIKGSRIAVVVGVRVEVFIKLVCMIFVVPQVSMLQKCLCSFVEKNRQRDCRSAKFIKLSWPYGTNNFLAKPQDFIGKVFWPTRNRC